MKRREFLVSSAGIAGLAGAFVPELVRAGTACAPDTVSATGNSPVIARTSCTNTAPAWFQSMPDKTWKKIANAGDFFAVNPVAPSIGNGSGSSIVLGNYCGACVDQVRGELLVVANGGHTDYAGNEAYAFRIKAATPAWYRLTDRTPDSQIDYSQASGNVKVCYFDGLPRAMHTFNVPVFATGFGKVIFPYTTDYSSGLSGNSSGAWWFDRDRCGDNYSAFPIAYATVAANGGIGAGYWSYLGLTLAKLPDDFEGSETCWDPLNGEALGFQKVPQTAPNAGESAWSINAATGAISHFNVQPASGNPVIQWASCTHNTNPPLAVVSDNNSNDIYIWNLAARSSSRLVRKVPTGSSAYNAASGWYPVWHAASYAFLFYDQTSMGGGSSIAKLAMNNPADPVNSTWTYSTVTASGSNTVTPPSSVSHSWSKFNIVQDMGNGQSALVVASHDQGVYVFKLPAGGV